MSTTKPATSAAIKAAFDSIAQERDAGWANEEEVRIAWVSALKLATGLPLRAERGRKDCSYNNVIIEFKAPGLFRGTKSSPKFKEATDARLLPYILKTATETHVAPEDFIGIAIDGDHICFAQVLGSAIVTQHLLPFSEYAVRLVSDAITSSHRKAVCIDNLLADFGHGVTAPKQFLQGLANALATELAKKGNSKVKMLFEEWRSLYGQVADMSVAQASDIEKELAFKWTGAADTTFSGRLFALHTYNSLLIKLLAAEVVSAHGLTSTKQPAQELSAIASDADLLARLSADIEHSKIFEQANIKGFVEEVIFSWYLDVARDPAYASGIIGPLRELLAALSLYRTDKLSHTRDVLRDLYHGLVPGKLRQSLGEFYTPDWLVDATIAKAKPESWLDARVLDPTCGSGSFLLAVLREAKAEAVTEGWSAEQTIRRLTQSVWGFDLNPLAVQTARVNFLMELVDLLCAAPGLEIEVPVLLADAIYSPADKPKPGVRTVTYQIGSQVAKLDIELPVELALNRIRLDQVFDKMGRDVEDEKVFSIVESGLIDSGLISVVEMSDWSASLEKTYNQILELHKQQWNGIWFRIVRNFFWSATAGQFDVIVGNPPWVRWSKLPELYRSRVKPTCEHYGIFSKNKQHAGNELDISAMITYTAADKWLKPEGRLAFVITGTIFKNPSSAGFRSFKIEPKSSSTMYLTPVSVDDLKNLKPFPDASNHTVIAVFEKSATKPEYPVPYVAWGAKKPHARAIPSRLPLADVMARIEQVEQEATPVGDEGSPWAVLAKGRFAKLAGLAGECPWLEGRKGITTDLNGVYFLPIVGKNSDLVQVQSRPDAGKKDIGAAKTAWLEPSLLYPLIKGAGDFEACYLNLDAPSITAAEKLYALVPNKGIAGSDYKVSAADMAAPALAKTRAWFEAYKTLLGARSTYKRNMLPQSAPYWAIYNVGDYTFQPWKVIWPEMSSTFYAAVAGSATVPLAGSRPYVPDHKVYFAGFDEKEPAFFLCGLLNSNYVRDWIQSHTISIQVGDVFKHLTLPEYSSNDPQHLELSRLVELAHNTHVAEDRAILVAKVRRLAGKVLRAWFKATAATTP